MIRPQNKIMKSLFLIMAVLIFEAAPSMAQNGADILGMVLDSIGFTRADLGYRPTGYWNRFPLDIPYKLTSFDALFSEPLKLYDYSKTMANAVERYLDPKFLDTTSVSLYNLTYSLGVDRKLGGFRNYSANLIPVTDSIHPLDRAMERLFLLAGEQPSYYAFGSKSDWPEYHTKVKELTSKISAPAERILAQAIINITDIIRWRNLAFRNCPPQAMQAVFNLRDLASTQGDGTVYHPELDDIARTIDWPSLHYAALKAAALVELTADSLAHYGGIPENVSFDLLTPFGRILLFAKGYYIAPDIRQSTLTDRNHGFRDCHNTLLVIDLGNSMQFSGACGATSSLANPVSLFIDLGGDDIYSPPNLNTLSQGAGLLGIGILYDCAGKDQYWGDDFSQGSGLFGVGILADLSGDDKYGAKLSSQGCGYFGIGLCLDGAGDDNYYLYGDGQGFGSVGGGVGVLADYSGNDFYKAEPYAKVFNRGDYHSNMVINGNGAQGVGFGRRGDGTDGHAWAGGLGAIIDISGNDHYLSGNWSLGCAYWFATGIAYDGSGDDFYESCYFTQGSGAHYCNGILIDEGGNDRHELFETAGAALGFGWDFTNAFLINIGGNDSYKAKMISMGLAQIRSNAFLIDIGGDDTYRLGGNTPGLGEATPRDDYGKPSKLTPYHTYCNSLGAFIDIGGNDKYFSFTDSSETDHPRAGNGRLWYAPANGDSTYGNNNFGVGVDIENGVIPELEKWK
ncbi:exported hypothetical protein [Candidatus Zixiibacteriota bacterium]|nr:exported hypothetical protein [candidate division Zixibacteria bacterium]